MEQDLYKAIQQLRVEFSQEEIRTKSLVYLRKQIFYISDPTLSKIECNINLMQVTRGCLPLFYMIIEEIKDLIQISFTPNIKVFTLEFKGSNAFQILTLLLKDQYDHTLYSLYQRWAVKIDTVDYALG